MFNVYSDGACLHNQKSRGRGGYGYVIVDDRAGIIYENNGCVSNKTSNEMELIAVIAALKDVIKIASGKQTVVEVVTDSNYIIQNWQKNLARWIDNGWKTKKGKDVANRRCWELLLDMAHRLTFISMSWGKGHAQNKYLNRADALAKEARTGIRKLPTNKVG